MKMVSLMLEEDKIQRCKEKGWHYREVFLSGMAALSGNVAILERVNELEEGNKKLQQKLSQFWQQLAAMSPKEGD